MTLPYDITSTLGTAKDTMRVAAHALKRVQEYLELRSIEVRLRIQQLREEAVVRAAKRAEAQELIEELTP